MKLRTPSPDQLVGLVLDEASIQSPERHHLEYTVKVIAPIYGGGVMAGEPDEDMPIRATAIRGQLRFWWRLLQSHGPEKLSGSTLFEKERAIWGGMGGNETGEDDKDYSSKVFIRMKIDSDVDVRKVPVTKFSGNTASPGLAYALFPDIKNDQYLISQEALGFTLSISAKINEDNPVDWKSVEDAVRWWASFGGIGARTRRGLGAVDVEGLECISSEEANQFGCKLKQFGGSPDAIKAWNTSINKLREFRQGVNVGRNKASDPSDTKKLGRSFWPEPDSIREITGRHSVARSFEINGEKKKTNDHKPVHQARISFPRAAFGLPIIFDFNVPKAVGEPAKTELSPVGSERMASPLILKPMALGEQKYASIALLLPVGHLETLSLELNEGSANLRTLSANEWWSTSKATAVDPISKNGGTDALTAFLNYFGGQ